MSSPETPSTPAVPFQELQVPGEPGVWYCARHKTVTTRLRCGRCEKPICPKCTIMGPTGARCADCASNRSSHIYQVTPFQYVTAFGMSMGMGALGAVVADMAGAFWFWALLYAPAIGPLWARLVTQVTKGKRGPKVAMVVSVGLIAGALLYAGIYGYIHFAGLGMPSADDMMEMSPQELKAFKAAQASAHPMHPTLGLLIITVFFGHFTLWIFLVLAIVGVWWSLK